MSELEYNGVPIKLSNLGEVTPKYYLINGAAARWMIRTGRPMMEWLWDDDLDTREPEEMPQKNEGAEG